MQVNTQPGAAAPQDRGKARAMVARAFLAQNVAVGSAFGGFGVSVLPLQQKYGASAGATGLVLALCVLVMGLVSPLVGGLIGRIGLRWTMLAGTVISALGYVLLAFAPSMTVVLALYALPIGVGLAMFGPFPASVLASNWNAHNPGLALGIANTPLFMALLPMIGMVVIRDHSLTALYLLLAGLHVVLLPALLGVSDGPADATHRPDSHGHVAHGMVASRVILRSPKFWVMCLVGGFLSAVGVAGVSHLGPFAAERGLEATEGAALLSIMGGASVAGSLVVGALCSRLGAARTLALVAGILGVSWAAMLGTTAFPLMAAATLLIGACGAGVFPAVNILSGKLFGQDSLPRVVGTYALVTLPLPFCLPPLAGLIREAAGNYVPVVMIFVVGCLAVAALFGLAGRAAEAPVQVAA
jgi:cyanate permease